MREVAKISMVLFTSDADSFCTVTLTVIGILECPYIITGTNKSRL